MKLIALDSSGLVASVAILESDQIIAEYTLNYKKTHSQTLLPMLDEVKKMTDIDLNDIDAIAVSAGPGSFTGLRIGSATAKGLGLALNKPIISVPTVDAMAYNLMGTNTDSYICPIMDARRNQVYTGIYSIETEFPVHSSGMQEELKTKLTVHQEACAIMVEELVARLNEKILKENNLQKDNLQKDNLQENNLREDNRKKSVIFLGDGVPVYQNIIREQMKVPFSFACSNNNRQRASSVALLGAELFAQGKVETAAEHSPIYLRMSQAEQERLEKEKK